MSTCRKDGPCELLTLADVKGKQRTKGHVAFRDCLKDYAAYLSCEVNLRAWPQEELLQLYLASSYCHGRMAFFCEP